jgi:hypothetical protein
MITCSQEFVHGAEARVRHAPAGLAANDTAGVGVLGEQLGDRQAQGPGDPMHGRDRRARHVALDLGQEALGDTRAFRDVAQREPPCLAQRPDAGSQLELGHHGRPPGRAAMVRFR